MFKLALNAGHGYETPGKRCLKAIDNNETREYVLNKRIADKIQEKLLKTGKIDVLRIDNGTDIAISKRAAAANGWNADFYLAVHHNAGISGGSGGGCECYVYLKVDDLTRAWQSEIYNEFITATGLKGNRAEPLRSADFGECRETKMPAVLIECGFMDSAVDTPIILTEEFAEKAANGIVAAICKRAGITVPENLPAKAPAAAQKSVNEIAREVILGRWGNGEERKTRLAAAGYDYGAVQTTVNQMIMADGKKKTVDEIAYEVINGRWANGKARKENLEKAGYNYAEIQKRVNEILL